MQITELKNLPDTSDEKLKLAYNQFELLLAELRTKQLPDTIVEIINQDVSDINGLTTSDEIKIALKQKQKNILKILEKQLKMVPKNYYRKLWFILGMSVFGLPLGVAIGTVANNIGLLGTGFPFGMLIGFAVGAGMDKKAFKEGRQLNFEVKY
jgi:hypothetical protein